jgi:hypothetical protein
VDDKVGKANPHPFELLVQERTLNRYVDKFAKNLAAPLRDGCSRLRENPGEHFLDLFDSCSSLDSAIAQIISKATTALVIEQPKVSSSSSERAIPSAGDDSSGLAASVRVIRGSNFTEILEEFQRFQQRAITDSHHSIYVNQDLLYRDLPDQTSRQITKNELISSTNQHLLLTAPPGGGKTLLQQEILSLARDSDTFHLRIDLERFSSASFPSFYRYAASQVTNLLSGDRRNVVKLEDHLLAVDFEGKICWHLDGWDELPKADLSSVALAIAPLSQLTLSTSNSWSAIQVFKSNGLLLHGVITIEPFAEAQFLEFIKANLRNPVPRATIERRAVQLSGLACLPRGVEFLCAHPDHETIVDVLLGYINSNLERIGEPSVNPHGFINDDPEETAFESAALTSTYLLVKAICGRTNGTSMDSSHLTVDEVLPYMGAGHRQENRQLAMERFQKAVRGIFLQVNADSDSFSFVVPEIGYLLAALATLSHYPGRHWLDSALKEFQKDPHAPAHQMMLALGAWQQEKLLLRQISESSPVGTVVPIPMESPLRGATTVANHSQT